MNIYYLLEKLRNKEDLSAEEAEFLINLMISGKILESQTSACLMAWEIKKICFSELLGAVRAMRNSMIPVELSSIKEPIIDVVGTGGDKHNTLNISSTVALLLSSCGVSVAKHGNKGVSSQCGSADILSYLKIPTELKAAEAKDFLKKNSFCFFFAPLYHPAMKNVSAVRQALKIRTIFNFLGPLANPMKVKRGLYGSCDYEMMEMMAKVALDLGFESAFFVYGDGGLDELSLTGKNNKVIEIKNKKLFYRLINPEDYGFSLIKLESILATSLEENLKRILSFFEGEQSDFAEMIIFNAAFALYSSGLYSNLDECFEKIRKTIHTGEAMKKLKALMGDKD